MRNHTALVPLPKVQPHPVIAIQLQDERTRTAFLLQLRVCGHWLLCVAEICKSRIGIGFPVPSLARRCRVLRAG
jgi:hypothetical protein